MINVENGTRKLSASMRVFDVELLLRVVMAQRSGGSFYLPHLPVFEK